MARGYHGDGRRRLGAHHPPCLPHRSRGRATSSRNVEQPSLIPGVLYHQPVTAKQWGAALESEFGPAGTPSARARRRRTRAATPRPASAPSAARRARRRSPATSPARRPTRRARHTVNNFRFHPDYRIDRILFREIIGTVDRRGVHPAARARGHRARRAPMTALGAGRGHRARGPLYRLHRARRQGAARRGDRSHARPTRPRTASASRSSTPSSFPLAGLDNTGPASHGQARAARPRCASSTCSSPCDDATSSRASCSSRSPPAGTTSRTPTNAAFDAGTIAPLQCVPNLDGVIHGRRAQAV